MKLEDITNTGLVGWLSQVSSPAVVQDRQQRSADVSLDDAPEEEIMFVPTPQPVWPRVWPGL